MNKVVNKISILTDIINNKQFEVEVLQKENGEEVSRLIIKEIKDKKQPFDIVNL